MYPQDLLQKVGAFNEDVSRSIMQYTSRDTFKLYDAFPDDLEVNCSKAEAHKILELFLYLRHLQSSNTKSRFLEMVADLNVPENVSRLFLCDFPGKEMCLSYRYKWRIDTSVPKVNAVLINFTRGDGKVVAVRLDVSTFHKFRFNVALLLKEINSLKKRHGNLTKKI